MSQKNEIEACETVLTTASDPLGEWRQDYGSADGLAFAEIAKEAVEIEDGPATAPARGDVLVSFRSDLFVRYLGERANEQGCFFHGFLFTVPGKLQVVAWVEDEAALFRVRFRGCGKTFEEAALQLTQHRGAWLARQRTA